MFKFETLVLSLTLSLTASLAGATESSGRGNGTTGTDCSNLYNLAYKAESDHQTDRANYLYKQAENCIANQSKNGDDCRNAPGDYKKAQAELSKACGLANLNNCVEELSSCTKSNEKGEDDDGEERTSSRSRRRDANQPYDVDAVKKQCPAMAGKDLEKLEKEMKDQKEKVRKLEEELPKLEAEANKVMSSTNEKMQNLKSELADKEKKLSEDLQKLSDDKDGAEKAITDQVTSIAAQITKANDALSQVSVTRAEGALKLKQTKIQTDLNCHASASAQVAKMQTDVLEGIKTGTFNAGGFSKMMNRIGLSDRQHWQKLAQKYYQWCLESKPTKDSKDGANDGYKLLLKQADNSEKSIHEQIRQLQTQQRQLVGGACTGQVAMQANGSNGGETQLCQAVRKAMEKSNQLRQAFETDRQKANEKYEQLRQDGTREYQRIAGQAARKKQEVADEKKRLDNLQQFLQAKYEKSGGNSQVDGKGLAEAMARMVEVQNEAENLVACKKREAPTNPNYCTGLCDSAKKYLERVGVKNYDPVLDTSDPAAIANGGSNLAASQISTPPPAARDQGATPGSENGAQGVREQQRPPNP